MERNFENKYEYAIDLLDNYSNMVNPFEPPYKFGCK